MTLVVGLGLLLVAVWRTVLWVDFGDSTCGPLYRPDIWLDGWCFRRTVARLLVAMAAFSGGVALIAVSVVALLRESREGRGWLHPPPHDETTSTESS